MKVVLKSNMIDHVLQRISEARRMGREVDYIVVTPKEYDEMRGDSRWYQYATGGLGYYRADEVVSATIKTRNFPVKLGVYGFRPGDQWTVVAEMQKFHGHDVFVLPYRCEHP